MPVPLVVYSGGYDSTLMLLELTQTTDVDVVYIKGRQCHFKAYCELKTVMKVIDYINKQHPFKVSRIHCISQPLNVEHLMNYGWTQPLEWMLGALNVYKRDEYSDLYYGLIHGDCVINVLPSVKALWSNMVAIIRRYSVSNLIMPLMNHTKDTVLLDLINKYPNVLPWIWTCESPEKSRLDSNENIVEIKRCGTCLKCKEETYHWAQLTIEQQKLKPTKQVFIAANTKANIIASFSSPDLTIKTVEFLTEKAEELTEDSPKEVTTDDEPQLSND